MNGYRERILHFATDRDKAAWLERQAADDAAGPVVRVAAAGLLARWGQADGGAMLAQAIHELVRDRVRTVPDVANHASSADGRGEQLACPDAALERGYDDCDGKARLVRALAGALRRLAVPIAGRLVYVWRVEDLVHVTADLRWHGSDAHPLAQAGGWVRSETTIPVALGVSR